MLIIFIEKKKFLEFYSIFLVLSYKNKKYLNKNKKPCNLLYYRLFKYELISNYYNYYILLDF